MEDFEKVLFSVEKQGRYKKISFKNKALNWAISRIGWGNLCSIQKGNYYEYKHYCERFIALYNIAKDTKKGIDCCFIPNLDFYEEVVI